MGEILDFEFWIFNGRGRLLNRRWMDADESDENLVSICALYLSLSAVENS
jgi:hypothetical protein